MITKNVESLERLDRDYDEIKEIVVSLKSKGVKIQFLNVPFLNVSTGNVLLDKVMFDIFLSLNGCSFLFQRQD